MADTIMISVRVKNSYEAGNTEHRHFDDQEIPAPPTPEESYEAYTEWVDEEIIARFTGTGEEAGDAWYDVTVTACSDSRLIGRVFTFG